MVQLQNVHTYKHNKCHILVHMAHQECHVFPRSHFPAGTFHTHRLQPYTIHFAIDKWWTVTKLKWNSVIKIQFKFRIFVALFLAQYHIFAPKFTYILSLVNDSILFDYFEKNRLDRHECWIFLLLKSRRLFDKMSTI